MSNDRIRAARAQSRALAEGTRLAGQRRPAPGGHAAPRAAGSPLALWPWDTTPGEQLQDQRPQPTGGLIAVSDQPAFLGLGYAG